jgi:hypothetical protein
MIGETLKHRIGGKPMETERVLELGAQMADGRSALDLCEPGDCWRLQIDRLVTEAALLDLPGIDRPRLGRREPR